MSIATLSIDLEARLAKLETDMGKAVRIAERNAKQMESAYSGLAGAFDKIKFAAAGAFAGITVGSTITKLAETQRQFDVLNASLVTVTGSAGRAAIEFEWIKEFAATTPFDLAQVTNAFIKMKALGLDASMEALRSYGNTASAMGKDLNQMIEAVADAATGEFERLRDFGIRASRQGDQVTFTFQGISKTIRNSSQEITKYLSDIGNNQFASATAERAKTLDGALSNLGDTWDELFLTINEAGVGQVIYDSVKLATTGIEQLIANLKVLRSYAAPQGQMAVDVLVGERETLRGQLSQLDGRNSDVANTARADIQRRIEAINNRIRELQEENERRQYEERTAPPVVVTASPLPGGTGKPTKSTKDPGDPLGDFIVKAIDDYNAKLDQLRGKYVDLIDPIEQFRKQLDEVRLLQSEGRLSADQAIEAEFRIQEAISDTISTTAKATEVAGDRFTELLRTIEGFGQDAGAALVDFALTGKTSFSEMVESMLADIAKLLVYQNVTKPLMGYVSNAFGPVKANADGGVYSSPGLSAYSGQVVSKPTLFPFANGMGLMGEAGPEAILPLKRGADGKLGVRLSGGGGAQVNVVVNNNAPVDVQQTSSTGQDGSINIELMITERVTGRIIRSTQQGAGLAPLLENKYGLNPAAGARR